MTSMEAPRLLSEYFAARAQSAACISAPADVDATSARSRKLPSCVKHNHEEPRMCESRHRAQTPTIPVRRHRQRQLEHAPWANGARATLRHSAIRPDFEAQNDPGKIARAPFAQGRSEEHTSELQSQSNLVCRLLLEKKKKKKS